MPLNLCKSSSRMHHCSSVTIPPPLDVIVLSGQLRTLTVETCPSRGNGVWRQEEYGSVFTALWLEKEGVVVEFSNADRPNTGSTVQEAKRSKWLHFRAHQRSLSHLWDLKERQKHDYFLLFDGGAKQSGSFVTIRQLTHMFDLEDRGWGFIEASPRLSVTRCWKKEPGPRRKL